MVVVVLVVDIAGRCDGLILVVMIGIVVTDMMMRERYGVVWVMVISVVVLGRW